MPCTRLDVRTCLILALVVSTGTIARTSSPQQSVPDTRTALITQRQIEKVPALHPYEPTRFAATVDHLEDVLVNGTEHWHPFFESAYAGGGFTLGAGYVTHVSWRFRDRHSLLMQAEWRVIANRFMDMALFYDTGKVASRTGDLDFDGLKSDYGIGLRLHGPTSTPLRIELAKGNEGFAIVFSAKPPF
jgi:hypothetical protein